MKSTAFEVENERVQSRLAVPDECADAVVEGLGGGEEETAVEAQYGYAGEGLVVRIVTELAKRPGTRWRPSTGIRGEVAT